MLNYIILKIKTFSPVSSLQIDGDRKESTSESSLESSSGYSSQTAISNAAPDEGDILYCLPLILCSNKKFKKICLNFEQVYRKCIFSL